MPEKVFQLSRPLHVVDSGARGPTRERTIAEVTLREPAAADLALIDRYAGRPVELALALVQALTGLAKAQVGKLATADLETLGKAAITAAEPGFVIAREAGAASHSVPSYRTRSRPS